MFQESKADFDNLPIHLVSFSKGCVVLNQLALQLKSLLVEEDKKCEHLLRNIQGMCWLDSGVPGNKGAYPSLSSLFFWCCFSVQETEILEKVILMPKRKIKTNKITRKKKKK